MTTELRTGELTKMMNLIVKSGLEITDADIRFLRYCRQLGCGKLSGVLIKDGIPVMADKERHDVRFDVENSDLT
jgi:hypothetical protein